MAKFLDSTGVSYLMTLVKNAIGAKKASVSDNNPSLSWGTKSKVGTVDGTDLNVTMPSNPNTDRYVNSAAFAQDTTNGNVKMTLTRSGSDSGTVTANIPAASTSAYGVTKLSSATNSTSTALAATASAVKAAYDLAATKTSNTGTVTGVKVGSSDTATPDSSGVVSIPAYPTTLPASDVSSWAKASSKPTYTKSEVGLGNVTNDAQVKRTEMGAANGVATLGSDGKVPSSQLPSYVDDVVEGYYYNSKFYTTSAHSTEITGEAGKIYVDITDGKNKTYRYSGSAFVEISSSDVTGIKVGSSGTTISPSSGIITIPAYETGAQVHKAPTATEVKSALGTGSGTVKFLREDGTWQTPAYTTNTDTKVTSAANHYTPSRDTSADKTASGASGSAGTTVQVITGLQTDGKGHVTGIVSGAATDTTYSAATTSAAGLMSAADKSKLNGIATGATAVSESTVAGWGFTKNTGTITSHQTIKQNAITGATRNNFSSCSTAAGTAAKTTSVTAGTPTLEAGLHVFVKFANANTASNPTLNINSTGAKAIWYDGAAIGTDTAILGLLNGLCEFEYDGTQWHLVNKMAALTNDDLDTLWAAA